MNKLIVLSIFLIIANSCSFSTNKNQFMENQNDIYVGMTIDEFYKIYPEIVGEEKEPNKQYAVEEQLFGLDGAWAYDFSEGILEWYIWDCYTEDINQENFNQSLETTQKLIEQYKTIYGEPDKYEEVELNFKDPYEERHWGYDVVYAIWTTDKMKIRIIFNFMGGKGMYNFLVKMEFHSPDYEYY